MSSKVGAVKYVDRRNCFITLSTNLASIYGQHLRGKKFVILTLDFGDKHIVTTWHGDTTRVGNDSVEISSLFANKLGIQDGSQVVITMTRHLPSCSSVLVEPISVDDWEILELHAAYLEAHLLDQTRVVWSGEVLPIWLQGNICIFVHISEIQPHHPCSLLEVDTRVIVLPRDRYVNQKPTGALHKNGRVNGQEKTKSDEVSRTDVMETSRNESHLSFYARMKNGLYWLFADAPYAQSLHKELNCHTLSLYFEISLRVQAYHPSLLLEPPRPRFDSRNPKSRSPPPVSTPLQTRNQSPESLAFSQPNTVCVSLESVSDFAEFKHGDMFIARLHKLWSPKEEAERKKISVRATSNNGDDSAPLTNYMDVCLQTVRVIVCDESGERGLVVPGHVMVSDFMRQSQCYDVTGRLVMTSVTAPHATVKSLSLVPDYGGRAKLDEEVILMAFRHWLSQCSSLQCPLVVTDGMVISVPLTNNTLLTCELRVEFSVPSATPPKDAPPSFGLISGEVADEVTIRVASGKSQTKRRTSTKSLIELDPKVPAIDVKRLGGVTDYLEQACRYVEFCLAVKPLSSLLLSTNVRCRGLLITGEKGVGKSAFSRLICDNFVDLPHQAFTQVIDCKSLRGKTSESIHSCLIRAYDEAKWRQPAILVLDDLDLIAAACSGPEQELSGEAMYYARVAEVMKDLLKTIIYERTVMVVVGVARNTKSLHPSLVSSRGVNYFEHTVNIDRPNQEQRLEILRALMEATPNVDPQTIRTLDLETLCQKTDGFVAKDLRRLLDRAVHSHLKHNGEPRLKGRKSGGQCVKLKMCDFEMALENFTILSLRDVSLHKVEEDIRWEDVGGLTEVKKILQETLLWPVKYPDLFARAPLRLRTGILLFGAPGSGKTMLARAVARECGLNFISIKGPELLNKFIGASEQAVRDTFARAQSAKPCILFFDEFDSLAPRRGHDSTGVTDRVVNQFLTQLDGFQALEGVFVLAATSRPDMIDPALLRPGRLDRCIYCPMPDTPARSEILHALSRRLSLADDVNLNQISDLTSNFTGADLKALMYNAQLLAVHRQLDLKRRSTTDDLHEKLARYATQMSSSSGTNDASGDTGFFDLETDSDYKEDELRVPRVRVLAKSRESSIESDDLASERSSLWSEVSPLSTPSDRLSLSSASSRAPIVSHADLLAALRDTGPSVPAPERLHYQRVYESFRGSGGSGARRKSFSLPGDAPMDNKVTLA